MALQQQPILEAQPQQEQFQPQYTKEQTKQIISVYQNNPERYQDKLEDIRVHAQYHNLPFYEGEFSIKMLLNKQQVALLKALLL